MSQTKHRFQFLPHFFVPRVNALQSLCSSHDWNQTILPSVSFLETILFIFHLKSFISFCQRHQDLAIFSVDPLRWNSILKWQQLNREREREKKNEEKEMQLNCSFWVWKTCLHRFHHIFGPNEPNILQISTTHELLTAHTFMTETLMPDLWFELLTWSRQHTIVWIININIKFDASKNPKWNM